MNFAKVSGVFSTGDLLPGNLHRIRRFPHALPTVKRERLYSGLEDLFQQPAYLNPIFEVTFKPQCPPAFINSQKLHSIGDAEWRETYTSQPVITSLLRRSIQGSEVALISQPISAIRNETDVNALYTYIEAWVVGLLRGIGFRVTGCREVRKEKCAGQQPDNDDAPADDARLRLDASLTRSDGLYLNLPSVGVELKAYGMNASDNWDWHSEFAENLQGQIIQYAKTLKIREMHCFDGLFWTQVQFSKEGYDQPAKVFRGTYENGVFALVTSFLASWLEKEFEFTKIVNARVKAQGTLDSEGGPVLVLMVNGLWYYSRTGVRVPAEYVAWIVL